MFYFQICYLFLRLFKSFQHSEYYTYMIIYQIGIYLNINSFTNSQIFKIR